MFCVDEPTAAAIRQAYEEHGDLGGIVEFRRHFPLITDHARVLDCVRTIASWATKPVQPADQARAK